MTFCVQWIATQDSWASVTLLKPLMLTAYLNLSKMEVFLSWLFSVKCWKHQVHPVCTCNWNFPNICVFNCCLPENLNDMRVEKVTADAVMTWEKGVTSLISVNAPNSKCKRWHYWEWYKFQFQTFTSSLYKTKWENLRRIWKLPLL